MRFYAVYTNTGDWGGHKKQFVIANNPEEAKLIAFGNDPDRVKLWIMSGYDISVDEIQNLDEIVSGIKVACPDGYKAFLHVSLSVSKSF